MGNGKKDTPTSSDKALIQGITFHCPHCKRKLRATQQSEGQRINCPGCAKTMLLPKRQRAHPKAAESSPDNDISDLLDEVLESAAKKRVQELCPECKEEWIPGNQECHVCGHRLPSPQQLERRKKYRRVAQLAVGRGISLIYFGLLLTIAAFLLAMIGVLTKNSALIGICFWLQMVAMPMGTVGMVLCIAAPEKYGKRFAIMATFAEFLAVTLTVNPTELEVSGVVLPSALVATLMSLTSYFLFLKFLMTCCEGMKQPGLVAAAQVTWERTVTLVFMPVLFVLIAGMSIVFSFLGPVIPIIGFVGATLLTIGIFAVWLLDYLQLLSAVRHQLLSIA